MAGFFLKPTTRNHARSISLPARTHPTTLKIEEELNKLRNLEISSTSMNTDKLHIAISSLAKLYKSIGDFLKLPQTQQALTKHQDSTSWVNDLLEKSVLFLDVCVKTREIISHLRLTIGKLKSTLRRRINYKEVCIEGDFADYVSSLKKLKREIGYLSTAFLHPKPRKWSLVLKLVKNKRQQEDLNEFEDVEVALNSLMGCKLNRESAGVMIQSACKKLSLLEIRIEEIEKDLECLYRQLIYTRVSLLNILSNH